MSVSPVGWSPLATQPTLLLEPSTRGLLPATSTVEKRKATVVRCVPKAHRTGHGASLAKPACAHAGGSASVNTVPAQPPAKVRVATLGLDLTWFAWGDVQPPTRMMSRAAAIRAHCDLAPRSIAPVHRSASRGSDRARGCGRNRHIELAPSIKTPHPPPSRGLPHLWGRVLSPLLGSEEVRHLVMKG